ncbi:hypothetical protein L596_018108 [Steinernema carpocapsae]|uniref:Uncharacterized protein n=1 Tax=Steinernema carpocapsae TaxID=34508 RepID=A0A4V6XW41_STECR|nr:hypothetical protein L596_018108 [Steinernema carpocapsae]
MNPLFSALKVASSALLRLPAPLTSSLRVSSTFCPLQKAIEKRPGDIRRFCVKEELRALLLWQKEVERQIRILGCTSGAIVELYDENVIKIEKLQNKVEELDHEYRNSH